MINQLHLNRYFNFINSRKYRTIPENTYTENHHIKPRCLGGSDEESNLIILTGREHFIAHLILWKAVGGQLGFALHLMRCKISYTKNYRGYLTSKQYNRLKQDMSKVRKNKTWEEIYGKEKAQEIRVKLSMSTGAGWRDKVMPKELVERRQKTRGEYARGIDHYRTGTIRTIEERKKMSDNQVHRTGEANSFYGRTHTKETKQKLREKCLDKTYEEMFGKEKALVIIEKRKKSIGHRKWMNRQQEEKLVKEKDIVVYKQEGWLLGRNEVSQEAKINMSKSGQGRKFSDEHRKRISESLKRGSLRG